MGEGSGCSTRCTRWSTRFNVLHVHWSLGVYFFVDGLFLLLMVIVYCCVVLCFERGPCSVIQASLELCAAQDGLKHTMILLPQSPECRDYMPVTLPSAAQVNWTWNIDILFGSFDKPQSWRDSSWVELQAVYRRWNIHYTRTCCTVFCLLASGFPGSPLQSVHTIRLRFGLYMVLNIMQASLETIQF